MIIPIDEKFRIKSTKDCWQVQELVQRTNKDTGEKEPYWKAILYYNMLSQAFRGVLRRELRLVEGDLGVASEAILQAVTDMEDRYKAVCQKIDAEWIKK